nr:hypothetical protein [Tanacetum cinerariifolium]GEZ34255.1 hypothetical protein [Tanacetum cinerariifolium]
NTANYQNINDEKQIHATVDGKIVVITESSVRKDLLFIDDNGITCLTYTQIFENLPLVSMLTQSAVVEDEGLGNPLKSQPTPSPAQPISKSQIPKSSSSPQNTQSLRQTLEGTGFPHTRGPNFPDPSVDVEAVHKEEGDSSGPGRQETIRDAMAPIRFEGAPIQSSDPPLSTCNTVESGEDKMEHAIELTNPVPQTPHDSPLSGGHTPRSDKGSMTLKELTILCTTLSKKVLDMEKVKTPQEKVIASFKKRVTKLEQRQSLRISGFHPFRAGTSRRLSLGKRSVSKPGRKNLKSQQKFQDTGDLVDEEVIVEDKGSGETGGSTAEIVSAVRPNISAARPKVSTAAPKTPPTTTTLFDDKDVTIDDTLVKMKSQKAKEKGVAFKDADDYARPIRSITTLQPLPTIDPKDKEQEMYTVEERSKLLARFFDRRKKHLTKEPAEEIRSKPPIKTQLIKLMRTYLKHRVRFTHAQLKSRSSEEIQKLYTKEQKQVDAFVPIGSKEDEKRVGSRKKRVASSSSKQNSPKKQKSNDQESVDSDTELRKCLKVVLDDDKAIDYENLDVKTLIVDCESQVQGTMDAGDVHVYKLTRLDESYKHFLTFSRMLEVLDRQDVLDLHKIVMERFLANDS